MAFREIDPIAAMEEEPKNIIFRSSQVWIPWLFEAFHSHPKALKCTETYIIEDPATNVWYFSQLSYHSKPVRMLILLSVQHLYLSRAMPVPVPVHILVYTPVPVPVHVLVYSPVAIAVSYKTAGAKRT